MSKRTVLIALLISGVACADTYLTPAPGIRANCPTCDLVAKSLTINGSSDLFKVTAAGIVTSGNLDALTLNADFTLGGTNAGNIIIGRVGGASTFYGSVGMNGDLTVVGFNYTSGLTTLAGGAFFTGGLTASGSTSNDFSGSTGTFKTSSGAVTIGPGAATVSGTMTLNSGATIGTGATLTYSAMCDSTGSPGDATCNQGAGRAAFPALSSDIITITNSLVTTSSNIQATLQSHDIICVGVWSVVPSNGSFVIAVNDGGVGCAAITKVAWVLIK